MLKRARELPLQPELEFVASRSTEAAEVYEVRYTSLDGLRIAGWYCRPRGDAVDAPYPGLVLTPGYIGEPVLPKVWAARGYATVSVATRGKLRSNRLFNPGFPGLLVHNIVDRDSYSYRGILYQHVPRR